jgi:hypothetical protein
LPGADKNPERDPCVLTCVGTSERAVTSSTPSACEVDHAVDASDVCRHGYDYGIAPAHRRGAQEDGMCVAHRTLRTWHCRSIAACDFLGRAHSDLRFVGSFPAACGQPHSSCLFPSQALFCALDLFVLAPHLPNSLAIRRHGSHSASACSKSSNARATPIPPMLSADIARPARETCTFICLQASSNR